MLRVRFVLVRPRNSLNVGAAARAMANFGLSDLAAVEPFEPRWRNAVSAVHGSDILRRARLVSLEEAIAGCHVVLGTASAHNRRLRQPWVPLPALGDFLREKVGPRGRAAILFGSEKTGLRNEDLQHCSALVRIPTRPCAPSINLGQAAALVAYELARPRMGRSVLARSELRPVPQQIEALLASGLAAMKKGNYNQHMPERTQSELLRRALLRWELTRGDAAFLQGLLRRLAVALLLAWAAPARAEVCPELAKLARRQIIEGYGESLPCRDVARALERLGARFTSAAQGKWSYEGDEALRPELRDRGAFIPEDLVVAGLLERRSPVAGNSVLYVFALGPEAKAGGTLRAAQMEEADSVLRAPGAGGFYDRVGVFPSPAPRGAFLQQGAWVPVARGGAWKADQRAPRGVRLCEPCRGWLCPAEPAACFSDFDHDGWEEAHFTGVAKEGLGRLVVVVPVPGQGAKVLFDADSTPVSWRRFDPAWAMVPAPDCKPGRVCVPSGLDDAALCARPKVWRFNGRAPMSADQGLLDRAYPVSIRRLPAICAGWGEIQVFAPGVGFVHLRP